LPVVYREPDLRVTDLSVPATANAGQMVDVEFTVTNVGTRTTREGMWYDRMFLSLDPTLDISDRWLGDYRRIGVLDINASYTVTLPARLPDSIEGEFYILAFADASQSFDTRVRSAIGVNQPGVGSAVYGNLVKEFQGEGNNITTAPLQVTQPQVPDLQVTAVTVPERVERGQSFDVAYTVTNFGGATPLTQREWIDLIYLSRDTSLDTMADRYLGVHRHEDGLAEDESYQVSRTFTMPTDLVGPWYVLVRTDAGRRVFEGDHENNNDRPSDPIIVELPPPADLVVTGIDVPTASRVGQPVHIQWTVANASDRSLLASWADTAYLSADATWDLGDRPLGRVPFVGNLLPGGSYTASLDAELPPVAPGQYRVIVRTDIFNQIFEDLNEANNRLVSAGVIDIGVDSLELGVPLDTTLSAGQQRMFQVTVPADQTLRVTLSSASKEATNELYLRHGDVPTSTVFDAAYQGALGADQIAVVPNTRPGEYFVLIRGFSVPEDDNPVVLLAELLPLTVSDVRTDIGGDSSFVTVTIKGAQFREGAIVKLVRPEIAEFEPVQYRVIDSSRIIAIFDLTDAPHGLYDLAVTNPDGEQAVVPYRFQVERAIEPEVTIGIGGPRAILAGDTGTFSVTLQGRSNLDAPYVFYRVGVPEMGPNPKIFGLPFVQFATNLRGTPESEELADVPWASLDSATNTTGHVSTSGYLLDQPALGFSGFSFNIATYPGLRELHDRAYVQLRNQLTALFPAFADLLTEDQASLAPWWNAVRDDFADRFPEYEGMMSATGYLEAFAKTLPVPKACLFPFIPFEFHVFAEATAMTREEFMAHQRSEAERLRQAILVDENASSTLLVLAADAQVWGDLYIASIEQAGLLRPEGEAPPVREQAQLVSLLATLAGGILVGPAGSEIRTSGNLVEFFEQVRGWYGHDPDLLAPVEFYSLRKDACEGKDIYNLPVPALPDFEQADLGLSQPTHFETFRVYAPWIPFERRGGGLPPEFQIDFTTGGGLNALIQGGDGSTHPLDLSAYLEGGAESDRLASVTGPITGDSGGMVPMGHPLPYTIRFENPATASTHTAEIRVVTELDEDLDPHSFRLGDLEVGDIHVHIPQDRALFQGEFDFTEALGLVLRVSAGIDIDTRTATWLLEAIDPLTGELCRDPNKGLLPPNAELNQGAGFVSYTVRAKDDAATGNEVAAQARVLFNNAPPQDTLELIQVVDAVAPTTRLTVSQLSEQSDDYTVSWNVTDDVGGSGFRHVTIYVAVDGGDFRIWQRRVGASAGSEVFEGEAGHSYEFLALATDMAGNREPPTFGFTGPSDGSTVNLGAAPSRETTPPNFGIAPAPSPSPATNRLFLETEQGIPAAEPASRPPVFDVVLRPFVARSFATGIAQSNAGIGPMAIAEAPDGTIIISGGQKRSSLFRFDPEGGEATEPWVELEHPIFNLAFDDDGNLWATTGGGPLLQLDSETGTIVNSFGDGLTIALAIKPDTGLIYVSSGKGVEIFDPATQAFTHYSRDLDLRVGCLAFDDDGRLWATTWPDREQVIRFTERARAETILRFDSDIDSIAFGRAGTQLEGLLFVSHNTAPRLDTGEVTGGGSDLTMVDLATLRTIAVARGGSRGDVAVTTSDGRVLLSQSEQVDVLKPVIAPIVIATNPPPDAIVALPWPEVTVTFDTDMVGGDPDDATSVINPANYVLAGDDTGPKPVLDARYDIDTRTVRLTFAALDADGYELTVSGSVSSIDGQSMSQPHVTRFAAVSDLSALTDIEFVLARSDRGTDTVSYDVTITNIGPNDLLLPLILVLDPALGNMSAPQDAIGRAVDGRWFLDLSGSLPADQRLEPGESTLGRTITIADVNGRRVDYDAGVSATPSPNIAPVIYSDPVTQAAVGQPYGCPVQAHDPDGLSVVVVLIEGPDGMTLDGQSGLLSWLPDADSPDRASVVLHAYDALGGRAAQSFTVDVDGGNRAPSIAHLPVSIQGWEGLPLDIPVDATDPDGDTLWWRVHHMPPGASFDPSRWALVWTPDYDAAGTYPNVTFVVSDGFREAVASTTIEIAPTDRPPELLRPADRTVREGDRLGFFLQGSDPDGLPVTYDSHILPPGARLNPGTGLFEWTPAFDQAGTYEVPFTVSDGQESTTVTSTITVLNVNAAPVFNQFEGWQVVEGQTLDFRAFAFDPDNPFYQLPDRAEDGTLISLSVVERTVSYDPPQLPAGATFDPETARFSWTPEYDQAGQHQAVFSATDDGDGTGTPLTVSVTVQITVFNANRRPEIEAIPNTTVNLGETLDLTVRAGDPDGNPLTLSATSAVPGFPIPDFAAFTDNGDGTGVFRFVPGVGDRGDYAIEVSAVDDGDGAGPDAALTDTFAFVVSVASDNEPPVFDTIGDRVAVVDEPFHLTVRARDLDSEPLSFSFSGLPSDATLTPGPVYGTAIVSWTPDVDDIGAYAVTFQVTDGGNGNASLVASDEQTIAIRVRETNNAPLFPPIGHPMVAEGDTLTVQLSTTDPEGDPVVFSALNLPPRAEFDSAAGVLTWTPTFLDAGTYEDVEFIATDGHGTSSQTVDITVTNTNLAPVLLPVPVQFGREGSDVQFAIGAVDADGDPIVYSAVQGLPEGAVFDIHDGTFQWTPDFEQAGHYTITFGAQDPAGLSDTLDVDLRVGNRNRAPAFSLSHHSATLGQLLEFTVTATDPDAGTTLTYSAIGLPDGATLDTGTGLFRWTPQPGQSGEHVVTFSASDGLAGTAQTILIRAAVEPEPPVVTIVLTPGFPALPGQKVLVHALATSLADVTALAVSVDGQPLALDTHGRATLIAGQPGKMSVRATATDLDGLVGEATAIVKVRDPDDRDAPRTAFDVRLPFSTIRQATNLGGTVLDSNLDFWRLDMAPLTAPSLAPQYIELTRGETTVNNGVLTRLDPGNISNGVYRLRLTAQDMGGRTSQTETTIEINSVTKPGAYHRSETDLSVQLDGIPVDLVRVYDSLTRETPGSFGYGWRLSTRDVHVQTSVEPTGREALGTFNPLGDGSRVYLTLPDAEGRHVAFTFKPELVELPGVRYYLPAWQSEAGVDYGLESVEAALVKAGSHFYAIKTGQPYHPANPLFDGFDYTLTAPDGTRYRIETDWGIVEQVTPNGGRLSISDAGIVARNGEGIWFIRDPQGSILSATAPDGSRVVYGYDPAGNLTGVRQLHTATATHYAYDTGDAHLLRVVVAPSGSEAISYGQTARIDPVQADLGSSVAFTGRVINESMEAGETHRYAFTIRGSELRTLETGTVLVRATVKPAPGSSFSPGMPGIDGLVPLITRLDGDHATSIFRIARESLFLLQITGQDASTAGQYELELGIAGDVDGNGVVDGIDNQHLDAAQGSRRGEAGYDPAADIDGDGEVSAADMLLLMRNYGFVRNGPPTVAAQLPVLTTHVDLSTAVDLSAVASDPDGDRVTYRIVGATNGTADLAPGGDVAIFTPDAGYAGAAGFQVIADDGFNSSGVANLPVTVSDAPLVRLEITNRLPELDLGEQWPLMVLADFTDQEKVPVPASYVTFTSTDAMVAPVSSGGVITGMADGTTGVIVSHGEIHDATAVIVGSPDSELDRLASTYGLNVYPFLVTLPEDDGFRQLLVRLRDDHDITGADAGTIYVSSNEGVVTVTEGGRIQAVGSGEATVAVLHGPAEAHALVRVTTPRFGEVMIGEAGAIVQSTDGYAISVPPGGLSDETMVSVSGLVENELPLDVPADFAFVGAFDLDVGVERFAYPIQVTVPAGNLPAGESVYFFRYAEVPNAQGELEPSWILLDEGIVSNDGYIHTTSPPWPGLTTRGKVLVAESIPKVNTFKLKFNLPRALAQYGFFGVAGIMATLTSGAGQLGSPWRIVSTLDNRVANCGVYSLNAGFQQDLPKSVKEKIHLGATTAAINELIDLGCDIRTMNTLWQQGAPFQTYEVSLWFAKNIAPAFQQVVVYRQPGANVGTAIISAQPLSAIPNDPFIESVDFRIVDEEPFIELEGRDFLADPPAGAPPPNGSKISDLKIHFKQGSSDAIAKGQDVELLSQVGDKISIKVKVPKEVILGLSEIYIERPAPKNVSIGTNFTLSSVKSNSVRIYGSDSDLVFAGLYNGQVVAIEPPSSEQISDYNITVGGHVRELIDVKANDMAVPAIQTAVTSDRTRVYALVPGGVAVLDAMTLRQVDVNHLTPEMDIIKSPDGASSITVDPFNDVLHLAGSYKRIYVIDISPDSETFHKHVDTIVLKKESERDPKTPYTSEAWILHGMAVNADGRRLYVTEPRTMVYSGTKPWIDQSKPDETGRIVVVNIDPADKPKIAGSNPNQWREEIASFQAGMEPYKIVATDDPDKMLAISHVRGVTGIDGDLNTLEAMGLWALEVTNDAPESFDAHLGFIPLEHKTDWRISNFELDLHNAAGLAVTRDKGYAFVADYAYPFYSNPLSVRGAKIGIVKDPFGPNPSVVAVTTPIPFGFADSVALTADERLLYVSYRGVGDILVFDVNRLIEEINECLALPGQGLYELRNLRNAPIDVLDCGGNNATLPPLVRDGIHTGNLPTGLSVWTPGPLKIDSAPLGVIELIPPKFVPGIDSLDTIIRTRIDAVNGHVCTSGGDFTFVLNDRAKVSLYIDGDSSSGEPAQGVTNITDGQGPSNGVFQDVLLFPGKYRFILTASGKLSQPGRYSYTLVAVGDDGQVAKDTGWIDHDVEINSNLPLAHTIIKGVDIWDGHLIRTSQDVIVPGRGMSLDFTRTYSSLGSSSDSPMGAGWTFSYDVRLIAHSCGGLTVIGGEGTGNRFDGGGQSNAAKAALFGLPATAKFYDPQIGYHSTLVQPDPQSDPNSYDFYTKSHVRYHFELQPPSNPNSASSDKIYTLRFIEEPNGNRINLYYDTNDPAVKNLPGLLLPYVDSDPDTLDLIEESSGRALILDYSAVFDSNTDTYRWEKNNQKDPPDIFRRKRITRLTGYDPISFDLHGLDVRYEYDSVGNLIQVSRDKRVEKYTYTPGFDDSGHNMLSYTDPNGNVTTYKYLADTGKAIFSYPGLPAAFGIRADEFVNKVIEPGGRTGGNAFSTTTFTYNISTTPGTPNKRIVQDPRPIPPTVYTLNDYGATVKIEAPLGKVTTMEWATPDSPKPNSIPGSGIDIQLVSQTDSLGLHRAYKYDELGNLTQETVTFTGGSDPFHVPVVDASGSAVNQIVTTYTYDPLFSKTTSKTDAEGNSAYYVYDSPTGVAAGVSYPAPTGRTGNMVAVINAAGETTKFAYDTKGDLLTQTDPRGKVTKYTAYDPYGNATQIMDPEGNMTTRAFDARGRLLTQTDTFGHRVEYAYDTLDRKIRETRYDDLFNQAPEQTTYQYKPGGEVITMTDGLGQETSYQYDTGNRPVTSTEKGVTAADGSTTDLITRYAYDENGNIIQETDPRSVVRTFIFDALNRNTKIELTVGQALETWQLGYDTEDNQLFAIDNFANKTEYIYDRLHRPVKTILPFPNAVVETRYNLVGNKVRETDANGNPMTYSYDKVYRLKKETDALDNSVEYTYDKSGNVVKAEHRTGSQFTYEVTYDNGVEIQDGLGRPTKVNQKVFGDPTDSNTSPVVYTTTTLYDDTQNRIVITDPRGFEIEELRDGLDRVRQRSQDPQGLNLTTVYSYDGNGNLKTIQDPQNGDKDVEYTYDGLNRMIRADYQQGYFETYFYDGVGNLIKQTDRRGIVFQTDYDELNRPIEERVREDISGGGQWLATAVYTYDDANLKVTIEDAKGNPTVHQYDKLGRVESTTDALSHTDYFIYDGVNLIERIDRLGRHTMYDYDDLNRLILTEEGDPTTTRTTMSVDYQDDRNRVITTDRRGIETIVQNDSLGRRVRVSRKDPGLAADYGTTQVVLLETEYDGNSNKTFVRDAEGNETKFLYDGANRQVEMITGFGSSVEATTKYTYDDVGNLLTVKDARATGATADMTYTYDALYRWTKAVDGEGNATLYTSYDGSNNLLSMTEPAGPDHTTTYTYDEFNTLLSVDETRGGAGGVTSYLYDANRNRVAQQDANGNLVTYAYDVLNRLTDTYQHLTPGQITATTQAGSNPGGSLSTALHTHYDYDDVGNQTLIVDPEGQRVDLAYDYLDRLEKRVYSNHVDPDLDYQPHSIAYGYDDNSNLISVIEVKRVDGANVTESYIYDYDQLDRLVEAKNYDGKIISYTYDKQGNRLSVTDPDGITTTYTYDERNRLDTATTEAGTTTYAYFPDSLLKSIAYPNGTVASYPSYDRADRLLSIVNHDGASQALSSYQYSYDANSNRKSQVETQYDINGGMPETTTYEYDRLNRLTRVTYGATGLGGDVSYTYSKNGNRLTEKGTDPTDPSQSFDRTYAYDRVNRLWSVTDNVNQSQSLAFTYDANGNRISKAAGAVNTSYDANGNPLVVVVSPSVTIPYAYSIRDQLVATTDGNGSPVKFDYDHARMRVKKIDAAGETRYLYDDRSTLLEYDTAGQTRIKYDYGDRLLSRVDVDPGPSGPTRTSQFYACDGLNSVVNLTADTGALQVSYQYDAWGNFRQMVGSSDNPKTYTGHEYDPETGLYYFKARYYDSDIGAFISQDSYLGQVDNPPSLHRYLYAHANPLTYVDPTGYEAESNRQLMGLDEKSYRETLEKGGFLSNVGLIFKDIGYNLWDAATVGFIPYIFTQKGFVSKHDRIFEAREKGKISDLEYWSGTVGHASLSLLEAATAGVGGGAAAAKIGVKAGLSVAWSGLKTAGAHTVKQGIAGAAKGGLVGAAIGAGLNAAEQGIDIGAGMRQQFNAAEFGQAAKWGLVFGAGIGGVAGGAKGILMDSYAARARATAASAAESGAIFGQAAQPAVTSGEAPTPRVVGENPASPSFGARNALPPSELPTSPRGRGGGGGRGGDPSETLQSAFELTQPIAVKAGEFTPGNVRDQLSRLNFEIASRKKALALAEEKGGWANRDTTDPTLTQANPTRRLVNDQIVMDEALVKKAEQRSLYDFGKESDFRPMSGVDAVRVETIHEKFHAMIDYLMSIGFPIVENKKALIVVALETELRNIAGLSRNLAKLVGSVWQEPDPVSAGDASIIALLSPDTIPTTALATWSGLVSGLAPFTLTLAFEDLPGSQLGETHTTTLDPSGNPSAGTIILDTNAAGVGWFVDPTPFDTSELSLVLDDTAFQAAPGSPAADKYDLLTVLLHEIGHLAGFTPYLAGFASHVETIGDTQQFVTPDFGATLSPDGEHLDGNKYPNDLMGAELTPSIRRLPSQLDVQIISAARGITPPSGQSSPISSADSTDSTIDDSDLTHAQAVWTTGDWPQFDEALMAEGYVEGELSNELLETDRIAAITGDAVAHWKTANIVDEHSLNLQNVRLEISDLPDQTLARTRANLITLDDNAAGHGWFIDKTPWDDNEFQNVIYDWEMRANANSPAVGKIDLLTVLMHEMGHIMGLPDVPAGIDPSRLMTGILPAGVRRLPSSLDLAQGTGAANHGKR